MKTKYDKKFYTEDIPSNLKTPEQPQIFSKVIRKFVFYLFIMSMCYAAFLISKHKLDEQIKISNLTIAGSDEQLKIVIAAIAQKRKDKKEKEALAYPEVKEIVLPDTSNMPTEIVLSDTEILELAKKNFKHGRKCMLSVELDNAIKHFELAVKYKPDYYLAYINLGHIYQHKKQLDKAVENFQKGLPIAKGRTRKELLQRIRYLKEIPNTTTPYKLSGYFHVIGCNKVICQIVDKEAYKAVTRIVRNYFPFSPNCLNIFSEIRIEIKPDAPNKKYEGLCSTSFIERDGFVYAKVKIDLYQNGQMLYDTLPHELTHAIINGILGFDLSEQCMWLHEGAAQYQEENNLFMKKWLKKYIKKKKSYMPLTELIGMTTYPESNERNHLFYAESLSFVDYLIKRWGKEKFSGMVNYYRMYNKFSKDVESLTRRRGPQTDNFSIFERFYGVCYSTIYDLEKQWINYILKTY